MRASQLNELAFIGKITAGTTHELKNVLAIIKESCGLMQDLLGISKEPLSYHDRFQKAFTSIDSQIMRGLDLITHLNTFAHMPDVAVRQVDLNQAAFHFVALSKRFARLKNVVLKVGLPPHKTEHAVFTKTNALQLQMALFFALECWLEILAPGNELTILTKLKDTFPVIEMQSEGDYPAKGKFADGITAAERWPSLSDAAAALKGTVEIDTAATAVRLRLPSQ